MERWQGRLLAGLSGLILVTPAGVQGASANVVQMGMPSAAVTAMAVAQGVTAAFEMNEPAGATVMRDSSGNGVNGTIDPSGVQSGYSVGDVTGYNWVWRNPTAPPADPSRVIHVPDNSNLEPGSQAFTIEMRYRTKEKFGNITQKGQAATAGGQWKIQNPGGMPSCLFKGSQGRVATRAPSPLNDQQWHVLTCMYDSTGVVMHVDGVYASRKRGSAGVIDNKMPMTVGGKTDCNQVKVTCDYFTGQIDYIRLSKPSTGNALPIADFSHSCAGLTCSFNSSVSSDPDGSLASRAWSFGDGQSATANNPSHNYSSPGSYPVTLTVVDNDGASRAITKQVSVLSGPVTSDIEFKSAASSSAGHKNPAVSVPPTAAVGQRMLLMLSMNSSTTAVGGPTGVTGWTELRSVTAGSMRTTVWTKTVQAGEPGAMVKVPLASAAKHTLMVATYSGVAADTPTLATSVTTSAGTSHSTPALQAPGGAWVVSYWADKSSSTTSWTSPSGVVDRGHACTSDAGRICSLLADSGGPVSAGAYGPMSARTNAPASKATMVSVVLAP